MIQDAVVKGLKIESGKTALYASEDFYFQAFFYLTKRFGEGKVFDSHKDAANWIFNVAEFKIQIRIDSTFVNFMIFGGPRYKNYGLLRPFYVAQLRRAARHEKELFYTGKNPTPEQGAVNQKVWDAYCEANGIDDSWNIEMFEREKASDWYDYIGRYNDGVMGVKYSDYAKYGERNNRHTKRALRVLKKFLNNMLTPIYVRDVGFNILGECDGRYKKYYGNIDIEVEK